MFYDEEMNHLDNPDFSNCTVEEIEVDGNQAYVLHRIDADIRKRAVSKLAENTPATVADMDELACSVYELAQSLNPLKHIEVPDAIAKSYMRRIDHGEIRLSSLAEAIRSRIAELRER